jgi:hypothetical protein
VLTISDVIRTKFSHILDAKSTYDANEALREVAKDHGLGVAILVAWQHGLCKPHRHIDPWGLEPRPAEEEPDPYMFVHVPARQHRSDTGMLMKMKLFNPDADPASLVYHEDGLIGTFSFLEPEPEDLHEDDIDEILHVLAQHEILGPANIENRQIQFKDLEVKRRIEASGKQVYVKIDHNPIEPESPDPRLPAGYEREDIWKYLIKSLKYKSACNYCSLQAFSPHEVTVNSAYARVPSWWPDKKATVRNYQFGFTFAPMGDPHKVCHFLAWDFPHISDLVMNMEPQSYSIRDLVSLVRIINYDIAVFCHNEGVENLQISGMCNHWAGNSIYHQHYQFFRMAPLPLLLASEQSEVLLTYQGVEVRKLSASWPAAAFIIRSSGARSDEVVIKVADSLAREWRVLNEGEDDNRFANKITIKNHSQNIFATIDDGRLAVVFIPRQLDKLNAESNGIKKKNAGVLEMMGYFLIDEPKDFNVIESMEAQQRKALGDSWLAKLGPPAKLIEKLEDKLRVCLSTEVDPYEQRIIDELLLNRLGDWRAKAQKLVSTIDRDTNLEPEHREHLYRELVWAVLEAAEDEAGQQSTE